MPQKKKKISPQQAQNLAAAQYKKEFFQKFRYLFNLFCNDELYHKIPVPHLERIFNIRSHSLRPVVLKGHHIPAALLSTFKIQMTHLLKQAKIKIDDIETQISLYDMLTAGMSLIRFSIFTTDNEFPGADIIKANLKKFRIKGDFDLHIREGITEVLNTITFYNNDLRKCLYWFRYEVLGMNNLSRGIEHIAYVIPYFPESISLTINGTKRRAFLMEWAKNQTGPQYLSIKPSDLNIISPFAEIPIKVYIQDHALKRLAERIDDVALGFAQYCMYHSFLACKVFYDNNHNLLIEYTLAGSRAGYFPVEIVDGIILVHTFLFITNNGTPEGQLLEKNIGLKKLDKKYLALDKLSTFMTSDIDENEFLSRILNESGCHSLIELYRKMKGFIFKGDRHASIAFIENYLKIDNSFGN
jgi:hypothetical protein